MRKEDIPSDIVLSEKIVKFDFVDDNDSDEGEYVYEDERHDRAIPDMMTFLLNSKNIWKIRILCIIIIIFQICFILFRLFISPFILLINVITFFSLTEFARKLKAMMIKFRKSLKVLSSAFLVLISPKSFAVNALNGWIKSYTGDL